MVLMTAYQAVVNSDSVTVFTSRLKTFLFSSFVFSVAHWLVAVPLKLRPYGTVQICLLLLLFFNTPGKKNNNNNTPGSCLQYFDAVGWAAGRASGL